MSFLYPRTISVTRPTAQASVGRVGYGGATASTETSVASGIQASIQFDNQRTNQEINLPGNAGVSYWRVLIPLSQAPIGLVQTRDIITDDLGQRYQVTAPYWNSLGYNLRVERLEA